jgi:hypothetical protein
MVQRSIVRVMGMAVMPAQSWSTVLPTLQVGLYTRGPLAGSHVEGTPTFLNFCMPVRTSACGFSPPNMPAAAAAAPAATTPPAIHKPAPPPAVRSSELLLFTALGI